MPCRSQALRYHTVEMTAIPLPKSASDDLASGSPALSRGLQAAWMLAKREWVRFFRQPFRVIAALGQPILFWILFGTGLHGAFRGPDADSSFMTYFLPGTTALILLFTAIFATISIIEDRREGFLQGVLVAPPGRWSIVLGKALGGSAIAWAQASFFLVLAWMSGSLPLGWHWIPMLVFLFIAALGITSLGVLCAWPMESTQGYHAIMNLVLLPMWLLSGAFFPIPAWSASQPIGQSVMHWIMVFNPMTYIVAGLRLLVTSSPSVNNTESSFWTAGLVQCWCVTCLFAVITFAAAVWMVQKRQRGEFQ
jgi:ABC-2 type transport system permease protein